MKDKELRNDVAEFKKETREASGVAYSTANSFMDLRSSVSVLRQDVDKLAANLRLLMEHLGLEVIPGPYIKNKKTGGK
jgi:hypothetical protein